MIYFFRSEIELQRLGLLVQYELYDLRGICISKVNAINYRICICNKWKWKQMRINTFKCELEPAAETELATESVATLDR